MTQLQQNRYDQLLRRVGDLKGQGSKVNDVLSELFPVFDVENLPPELYILGGIDLCFGGGAASGGAGTSGRAQLRNPEGSGKLVTITEVRFTSSASGIIRWGRRDVALTGQIDTQLFRDFRKTLPALPTAQVRTQASAALANATGQQLVNARENLVIADRNGVAVLTEGTGFEIGVDTQNTTNSFVFYWHERVAEPSETNF